MKSRLSIYTLFTFATIASSIGYGETHAQDTTSLRVGSRVRLTLDSPSSRTTWPRRYPRLIGTLTRQTGDTLVLAPDDDSTLVEIPLERISKVEVRERKGNGTLGGGLGVLIGGATGGLIGHAAGTDSCPPPGAFGDLCGLDNFTKVFGGALIGSLVGGLLGLGIGSEIESEQWVETDRSHLRPLVTFGAGADGHPAWTVGLRLRI